jgi:HD-GYP domain-containing protein (c-di-GMP phosphodiesterase class II)
MTGTADKRLSPSQLRDLRDFGERLNRLNINFSVCNSDGGTALSCACKSFKSDDEEIKLIGQQLLNSHQEIIPGRSSIPVWQFGDKNIILAVPLTSPTVGFVKGRPLGVAIADLGPEQSDNNQSSAHDQALGPASPVEYISQMLQFLADTFRANLKTEAHIEVIGTELAQVYEELVLLHRLSVNMKVTESDTKFLQMACDSLTEVVLVEGIAVLIERQVNGDKKMSIAAGSGLIDIDEEMSMLLHSRLIDEINQGKEALLDSPVDAPFKYHWPDNIKNIIAVPLFGKEPVDSSFSRKTKAGNYLVGMMVAVNRIDKPDFDSTDVKLFNSVVSGCAVFIENGSLFKDLKELFIGSLKALSNSIDAKDQYTRGHSERVALISRWIAERIKEPEPLEKEQIHKIYLAGLLHDIGKIGINEKVLRKTGKLTEAEYDLIKKHPSIGAGILKGIKQMRDIVPGVLCHHERMDGSGYPNGLTETEIPLIGKIVGLADSFDAMTSKRTYRDAMTVEQAVGEIEKNLGLQFDEKIGRIFIECNVYELWEIIQGDFTDIYSQADIYEYGTAAVGTLIQ